MPLRRSDRNRGCGTRDRVILGHYVVVENESSMLPARYSSTLTITGRWAHERSAHHQRQDGEDGEKVHPHDKCVARDGEFNKVIEDTSLGLYSQSGLSHGQLLTE